MGKVRPPYSYDRLNKKKICNGEEGGKFHGISGYEDVLGSEDEFHLNRDKIMLDELPEIKRKFPNDCIKIYLLLQSLMLIDDTDDNLDLSDHEILAYSDGNSDEEHVQDLSGMNHADSSASVAHQKSHEDIYENDEGWGSSKHDYYNHDRIETEADALEEEAEALRLQKKKLYNMSVADFGLNEDDWLDNSYDRVTGDVVSEVLEDVKITSYIMPDERLRVLQIRYPEFEPLTNELLELYPVLQKLQNQVESGSLAQKSYIPDIQLKFRALSAYVAALVMYFAILSSPVSKPTGEAQAFNPTELQRHPIMNCLLKCRALWSKVKNYKQSLSQPALPTTENVPGIEENKNAQNVAVTKSVKKTKISKSAMPSTKKSRKMKITEEELAELNRLVDISDMRSKKPRSASFSTRLDSDNSDYGEEDSMDAKSALEKAQKKKSLGFYTSQITQKAGKRMDAGRNAGGDDDCPHRERLRDRQARLNIEAERRGNKMDRNARSSVSPSEQSNGREDIVAEQAQNSESDYYNFVALMTGQKKKDKFNKQKANLDSKTEPGHLLGVESQVGEDGKRAIGYVIEKNKGLAPKRKKDVRNPRVKKRKKFEEKKKKLQSTRAVYKGGEERGGYGGEKTGIKAGLVKSVKL